MMITDLSSQKKTNNPKKTSTPPRPPKKNPLKDIFKKAEPKKEKEVLSLDYPYVSGVLLRTYL